MNPDEIVITELDPARGAEWAAMRKALWPDLDDAENSAEIAAYLNGEGALRVVLVALHGRRAVGFAEISERNVVDSCPGGPHPYLEGWYVDAGSRGQGIGHQLLAAAIQWARQAGYAWLGSDVELDNTVSRRAHAVLGFEETGRVVNYRLRLGS